MKSKKKSRYKFFGYNGADVQQWITATSIQTGDLSANLWIARNKKTQEVLNSLDQYYNKKTTR